MAQHLQQEVSSLTLPTLTVRSRHAGLPYSILLVTIGLTLLAAYNAHLVNQTQERFRFDHAAAQSQASVVGAIRRYLTILDTVHGLAAANLNMNGEQFRKYAAALDLRKNYPGLQGLGIAMSLGSDQKKALVERARAKGDSAFRIWPDSDQPELCPVIVLEPQDPRNRATIGYDIFSDPARRATAELAAQTGQPTASPKLILVGETNSSPQFGFVVCGPLYRSGMMPGDVAERKRDCGGFIYCSFVAEKFFKGVLRAQTDPLLDFRFYDGTDLSADHLLHASDRATDSSSPGSGLMTTNRMIAAGHTWSLVMSARPEFTAGSGLDLAPFILLGGGLISFSLFGIIRAQTKARTAAEASADVIQRSEQALRVSEQRYRLLFEASRSAEERFRRLVEQSLVGIYLIQGDRFVYVNPKMSEILGYSDLELTSGRVLDFIAPEDRSKVSENIRKRIEGQAESIHYLLRMVRKDGAVIDIEAHGGATEHEGRPAILGTLLDITERQRVEEERLKLHQELEKRVVERTAQLAEANQELEAFSYSVSHDLRAPLRHIEGYADLLTKELGESVNDKCRRYLEVVTSSVTGMGQLIEDLLAFSRMGRVELRKRDLDLNELVEQTIAGLERETAGRNIVWSRLPLPRVQGDPSLLRQVLMNLLSNALKYSRPRDPARIEIGRSNAHDQSKGEVVLFVRDNGVGFDMKYVGKLFGVFQRLHSKGEFEGTGIGLANVQRIISRHGGRIWVEAELDRGATFYFSLPQGRDQEGNRS